MLEVQYILNNIRSLYTCWKYSIYQTQEVYTHVRSTLYIKHKKSIHMLEVPYILKGVYTLQ